MMTGMACQYCGCTDERACPGGCHWVSLDVCSNPKCVAAWKRHARERAHSAHVANLTVRFPTEEETKQIAHNVRECKTDEAAALVLALSFVVLAAARGVAR